MPKAGKDNSKDEFLKSNFIEAGQIVLDHLLNEGLYGALFQLKRSSDLEGDYDKDRKAHQT
jgi:hypothetical protein